MYNLIVFGSLLHPDELQKHNISKDRIKYVKVNGFKRVFNQEPSWRKVDSINRAVMNIEPDSSSWFNALLISGLTKEDIKELDVRERGYDRVSLLKEDVIDYNNNTIENCIVYQGKKGKQNTKILPNKEYFAICLDGAKEHFEQFYQDYINTTYYYKDGDLHKIDI